MQNREGSIQRQCHYEYNALSQSPIYLFQLEDMPLLKLRHIASSLGEVMVGNRIFTNDQVETYIEENSFESCWRITRLVLNETIELIFNIIEERIKKSISKSTHPTLASATIDGTIYQGKEIFIYQDGIYIDRNKMAIIKPLKSRNITSSGLRLFEQSKPLNSNLNPTISNNIISNPPTLRLSTSRKEL